MKVTTTLKAYLKDDVGFEDTITTKINLKPKEVEALPFEPDKKEF